MSFEYFILNRSNFTMRSSILNFEEKKKKNFRNDIVKSCFLKSQTLTLFEEYLKKMLKVPSFYLNVTLMM